MAFTLGHSVTLALGTLGLPVPQQPVEALIAGTIIVAAAHAVRPIFPGREALVAASFGLIHGLAFSETLRELDLSGTRLVLSLLGFNLGIELMQLLVVALVLPPLVMLARATRYHPIRIAAASVAGLAAVGWLAARLGYSNPLADTADRLGSYSQFIVGALWFAASTAVAITRLRARRRTLEHPADVAGRSDDSSISTAKQVRENEPDSATKTEVRLAGRQRVDDLGPRYIDEGIAAPGPELAVTQRLRRPVRGPARTDDRRRKRRTASGAAHGPIVRKT